MAVSNNAASRLPLYRSAITRLKDYGAATINSCDIADTLGLTAAQVRKDFSMFRFSGRKKVGYETAGLLEHIDRLLCKSKPPRAVLCARNADGAMFLAEKLIADCGFAIEAVFDDLPSRRTGGPRRLRLGAPILPMSDLIDFVVKRGIAIGIVAVPPANAQRTLDVLVLAGIRGVLNLSGAEVKSPARCIVNSVNVGREFEKLVFFVNTSPARTPAS